MSEYSSNAYAREQRAHKATTVAAFLHDAGLWADLELWPPRAVGPQPSARAQAYDAAHAAPTRTQQRLRREIERRAGVRRCSETTWELVRELLEQTRRDAAAQADLDREIRW